MIPKLDYGAFRQCAAVLGLAEPLPESLPVSIVAEAAEHTELFQAIHTVLMDTHVEEAQMVCSKCERVYPISQGIPNMRLNETEVKS